MGSDTTTARSAERHVSVATEGNNVHVRSVKGHSSANMENIANRAASVLVMQPSAPLKVAPSMVIRLQGS